MQIPPSGSSTPVPVGGARSPFTTRGPSPILPPIRDLQSLPERNLNRPRSAYDDMATVRPRGFTQEFGGAGRDAFGPRSLEGDRFTSQPYAGSSGTPVPYSQPPYDHARYVHYPASYTSETECSSMMHSPPASNFGVLGDPIDSRGKRRRGNLPKPVTDILRQWFHEHLDHPYPSEEDKQMFMSRTGLSISQVGSSNPFFGGLALLLTVGSGTDQQLVHQRQTATTSGAPQSDAKQQQQQRGRPKSASAVTPQRRGSNIVSRIHILSCSFLNCPTLSPP